jgi:hypothetical protein
MIITATLMTSGHDGKANNEPGKRSLLIKSYAVCYKACNLQIDGFVLLIELPNVGKLRTGNKNKLIKIFACLLNLFLQYCEFISTIPDEKNSFSVFFWMFSHGGNSQLPDHIYKPNIHSAKLFKWGDLYAYPILMLGSAEQLELHFDDLDGDLKNYYYSFQLCNADWTPANLPTLDYTRGFQSVRITTYRNSSISFTRYTHYYAGVTDRSFTSDRIGNYLLKVFINTIQPIML